MTKELLSDAFGLLSEFLKKDEYYLDSSSAYGDGGNDALQSALELFLQHPEIGFVWLAYHDTKPVGVCVVCFAISTSIGAVVAKLDDVFVTTNMQNQKVGSTLITSLKEELRLLNIRRIDTSVHLHNSAARRFYEKHDFLRLNEERLSCQL
ncbi:MAG: GNAT family N-acetyltransferase [Tolypothrix carrinoi HA7290-LM1]|nr:GNAT family N-acetyltransferase [Tolypothrix carrinoi HA7290-LM1]